MKEHESWFKRAENYIPVAETCFASKIEIYDACCFRTQQAGQKYLKTFLVSRNISLKKTHDLQLLLKLIMPVNPAFNKILSKAMGFTGYNLTRRFPGFLHKPELADQKKVLTDANTGKQFVLTHFFE
jgi:HEPN domain-containing protein